MTERYPVPHLGLSKAFGLPGLRLGWLASQDHELITKIAHLKDYTTICTAAPSEALAVIAIRNREAIFARNRRIIKDNLELLTR